MSARRPLSNNPDIRADTAPGPLLDPQRSLAGSKCRTAAEPDLIRPKLVMSGLGAPMQFDQLKRREFIALLGAATAWPLAARAQRDGRIRHVMVWIGGSSNDPAS